MIRILIFAVVVLALAQVCADRASAQVAPPLHVFVLDVSGSTITSDPAGYSVSAARMTLDNLSPGRVAIVSVQSFEGRPDATFHGVFDLADPGRRQDVHAVLDRWQADLAARAGNTPLADAFAQAMDRLLAEAAPEGSDVYVFTDGEPVPEPEAQYEEINRIAGELAERRWRVHLVTLGSPDTPWNRRFAEIAAEHGWLAFPAASDTDIQGYFLEIYRQVTGLALAELDAGAIPRSVGARTSTLRVDPTMRSITIVGFRTSADTSLRLFTPQGVEIIPDHPLIELQSDRDPNYVFWRLGGELPAGTWKIVSTGAGFVRLAVLSRSDLTLEIISPQPGALAPVAGKTTVSVRLRDAEGNTVFTPAVITGTVTDASNRQLRLGLEDDGDTAVSGDISAADGVYTAVAQISGRGPASLELEAVGEAFRLNAGADFRVDAFPALVGPEREVIEVVEGRKARVHLPLELEGKPYDTSFLEGVTARILTRGGSAIATVTEVELQKHALELVFALPEEGRGTWSYLLEVDYAGTYRGWPFSSTLRSEPLEFRVVAQPPFCERNDCKILGLVLALAALGTLIGMGVALYRRRPVATRAVFEIPSSRATRVPQEVPLQRYLGRIPWYDAARGVYILRSRRVPGMPDGLEFKFPSPTRVKVRRCMSPLERLRRATHRNGVDMDGLFVQKAGGRRAGLERWLDLRPGDQVVAGEEVRRLRVRASRTRLGSRTPRGGRTS